jgi:hypothetical protein
MKNIKVNDILESSNELYKIEEIKLDSSYGPSDPYYVVSAWVGGNGWELQDAGFTNYDIKRFKLKHYSLQA